MLPCLDRWSKIPYKASKSPFRKYSTTVFYSFKTNSLLVIINLSSTFILLVASKMNKFRFDLATYISRMKIETKLTFGSLIRFISIVGREISLERELTRVMSLFSEGSNYCTPLSAKKLVSYLTVSYGSFSNYIKCLITNSFGFDST
jgi:hypothetical protein